jgi:hypothetical protein
MASVSIRQNVIRRQLSNAQVGAEVGRMIAVDVPAEEAAVQDLRLIVVHSKEHLRLWNELMLRDHPQGHRPLVGRQWRTGIEC